MDSWGWTPGAITRDELMADKARIDGLARQALATIRLQGQAEGLRLVTKAELHALSVTQIGGWRLAEAAWSELSRRLDMWR